MWPHRPQSTDGSRRPYVVAGSRRQRSDQSINLDQPGFCSPSKQAAHGVEEVARLRRRRRSPLASGADGSRVYPCERLLPRRPNHMQKDVLALSARCGGERRPRFRDRTALRNQHINLPQLRDDLFRSVSLPCHSSVLHQAISHTSGRTTSQGADQLALVLIAGTLELYVRLVEDDGMQFDLEMWKYAKSVKIIFQRSAHRP